MKIAIATGTRADWGLLQPPAEILRSRGAEVAIMATHQHLMPSMGDTIDEIRKDGFEPAAIFRAEGNAAEIMASAASGATKALAEIAPDALLILGDRCEMLGVASAALLSGVPIIHIAGGTVSEGAFDDSVRHAITKMATLHFPETPLCASRIIQMGENPDNVHAVGAIGVENALRIPRMSLTELTESLDGWNPGEKFLLVTLHAATLEDKSPLEVQENLLKALKGMPEDFRFILTYPNSDIDPKPLIESLHEFEKEMSGRAKVIPSLGRRRYLSAAALSSGVVGNSSSALVETPSLRVGSLDIGSRQKGREHSNAVIHCNPDFDSISQGLRHLISAEHREIANNADNPYEGCDPAETIADIILSYPFHTYPQKHFHEISVSDSRPGRE